MNLTQLRKRVETLRREADELLHKEIEAEMYRVMREHPSVVRLVKCMGTVIVSGRDGPFFEAPKFCDRLMALAELDTSYYSLTGHPLRLSRGSQGQIITDRDW